MTRHELLLNTLRMLLIGACVELTFARGSDVHPDTGTRKGQTPKIGSRIANGMKILGGSSETVLSLLRAQEKLSQHHKSTCVRNLEESKERDTNSLTAVNNSSLTTRHNSMVHHNSSSFLYDAKSQRVDTVSQRPTINLPLQLESFLETQSRCTIFQSINDSDRFGVDDVPDIEASQQIICELESEWEYSQQIRNYKQLPGDLDFDLAMSEEVVSELQQTFDLSRDLEATPVPGATRVKRCSLATTAQAEDSTLADFNIVTPLSNFVSKSLDSTVRRTVSCCGTPELFSTCKPSRKKLTHLGGGGGGVGEHPQSQLSSFSPELFGPTPLVCQLSSSPANVTSTSATPSNLRRSRIDLHTPNCKRSLLHDGTLKTPHCHVATSAAAAVSQDLVLRLSSSRLENSCISTPQTQSKESHTVSYSASSPDLFS